MRHEFRLADIGEGLEEAEIINWLVAVGDQVTRDQPLIEVMTDKSNAELPAPTAGTIVELGGAVGDLIMVGELIAIIDGNTTDTTAVDEEGTPTAPEVTMPRIKASPSTRRYAAEQGIDLRRVSGSGPGGRILLSDLETPYRITGSPAPAESVPAPAVQAVSAASPDAAQEALLVQPMISTPALPTPADPAIPVDPATPLSPMPGGVISLRGVRRAVAKNMAQSWSEVPHIHAFAHIDAAALMDLRSRLKATGRPEYRQLTPLAFFVAAVAKALVVHPQANASLNMTDETITYHSHVNVGVAVASPHGLVVPVLQAADRLDFATLSLTLTELVRGAREGVLSREHFRGGTVTITNFGALGGEQAAPLIRPPESMIVGFGSIAERPFVLDGQVVARSTMHTVVGADHRQLDGDTATGVLTLIGDLLADPLQLVL
jgi:pyruvate dehydrogenase E2 component (dihydrolipoamide acetyltransferase)